jgi:hypothetical protein
MLFAGFLGGTVNYYLTYTKKEDGGSRKYWTCVIIGLAASLLVPLFLKTISSNLINCTNSGCPQALDYLVFLGICLIAAIFSRRFIDSVAAKILKEAKEATEKAEQAQENVEQISESNDAINKAITENIVIALQDKLTDKKKDDNVDDPGQ